MAKKKIDKEAERTPSSPGRIVSIFKNETVHFVIGLMLVIFSVYLLLAFRHETVGNDTAAYFDAYHRISGLSFSDLLDYEGRFEIGYLFINRILSWLISDPQFLLIITGIFILVSNASVPFFLFAKIYAKGGINAKSIVPVPNASTIPI